MSTVKILIQLSRRWVSTRCGDDVLPIDYVKSFVQANFASVLKVEAFDFAEISFVAEDCSVDPAEITQRIRTDFLSHYGIKEEDGIITCNFLEAEPLEEVKQETEEVAVTEYEEPLKKSNDGLASLIKEIKKNSVSLKFEKPEPKEDDPFERLDKMVGGEEFKSLIKEIKQVAPQILQNKTEEVFVGQTYLFSINDGNGLTTYVSLFADIISQLKLRKIKRGRINEVKLMPPKDESLEPFEPVFRVIDKHDHGTCEVLCIDVSEWMNAVNKKAFKDFLTVLEKMLDEFIVIFRVPFVDKEVLAKIQFALNDLMFVRTVTFPPFTQREIREFARAELEKYGFKISNPAWEGFLQRITEEKSDGKFYGVNTIKKVVKELLYKKQASNAARGKNDLCISKKDTLAICANGKHLDLGGYQMLDKLVGCEAVKERITEIVSQIELSRRDNSMQSPCIHMRFVGNPGTGKTTVARILGKILKERGVLRIGNFFEYAGRDFCGRYVGETAPKTASMCRDAYGSVLFIDEAYSLYKGDTDFRDYGAEVLDTLIAEMENHRSDLVVIMAGYTDEMETLMRGNAGLASRMPYVIEFPNFSREQLGEIFKSMVVGHFAYEEDLFEAVKRYFNELPEEVLKAKEFSNARFVRNLFERTCAKAAMRCQLEKKGTLKLTKDDFERSISDKEFTFIMKKKNKIGFIE